MHRICAYCEHEVEPIARTAVLRAGQAHDENLAHQH